MTAEQPPDPSLSKRARETTDTFAAGPVTRVGPTPPAWPAPSGTTGSAWPAEDAIGQGRDRGWSGRRAMWWYGGAAAAVLVVGLVIMLVMVLNGQLGSGQGPLSPGAAAPDENLPPLARLCPAPSTTAEPPAAEPPPATPAGPRTVDEEAGISYRAYGAPWEPWPLLWTAGTLQVPYGVGQHFVTEVYRNGDYHASILSAAVPAAVNDSMAIDLECTGRQVAADVRAEYYPQPNRMELFRDERTTLGGRPAWVTKFRLHFDEEGLEAKDELVSVALIDVGRPTVAVLYASVPGTHPQWDYVVDEVLESVRPT